LAHNLLADVAANAQCNGYISCGGFTARKHKSGDTLEEFLELGFTVEHSDSEYDR
jgi:hypothetical protein